VSHKNFFLYPFGWTNSWDIVGIILLELAWMSSLISHYLLCLTNRELLLHWKPKEAKKLYRNSKSINVSSTTSPDPSGSHSLWHCLTQSPHLPAILSLLITIRWNFFPWSYFWLSSFIVSWHFQCLNSCNCLSPHVQISHAN